MDTATIHTVTFWSAIVLLAVGSVLGLMGVWMDNFWDNDWAAKLIITDGILFAAAVAGAVITKLLS